MIASLEGQILSLHDQIVILNINGVGFKVNCPTTFTADHEVGDEVFLHTQLIVRENDLSLYGFGSENERRYFNLMLAVDGIGPKAALNTLSKLSIDALCAAIINEDVDTLSQVPGIGKKTAQKIALYLKDKVEAPLGISIEQQGQNNAIHDDVRSALLNLGYTRQEVEKAISRLPTDPQLSVEESILICLQTIQNF